MIVIILIILGVLGIILGMTEENKINYQETKNILDKINKI